MRRCPLDALRRIRAWSRNDGAGIRTKSPTKASRFTHITSSVQDRTQRKSMDVTHSQAVSLTSWELGYTSSVHVNGQNSDELSANK